MSSRGFTVTRHYLGLDTAWRAEFTYSTKRGHGARGGDGRVVGVNAEMDALPGIGHACGHNLIAMAGVAIALALQAALKKHDVPGTVILLGTPGMRKRYYPITSVNFFSDLCPLYLHVPFFSLKFPTHSRGKWRREADPLGEGRL